MSGSIAVLREIRDVLQDDPSSERRWFHDDYFDLFVRETGGELSAFELCYGIGSNERALAWIRGSGYFHDGGMSGSEDFIGARLAPGDPLEADPIIARFELAASELPEALRLALKARLREYALQDAEGSARRARFRRDPWQRTGGEQEPKEGRG
ncbi:MAG TPA: hypothetical protein VEL09_14200 [Burkholderiales bacterium]|nr:hypothetical protein [Burkholderiales bacterium]